MNRNQARKVHKLTGQELNELIKETKTDAILVGVKGTMKIYNEVMANEFGFGKVRLKRLEDAVREKLGIEVVDNARN